MIANNVRQLRTKRGKTQTQMAVDLDVTRQTIIAIESGKYYPSLPLALRISRYFSCRLEDIFWIVEGDHA